MGKVNYIHSKDFYSSEEDINDIPLLNKIIEKATVYKGKIFDIDRYTVELPNKEKSFRDIVSQPNAVGILAFDEKNNICLVRQYRTSIDRIAIEIPAGRIEPDEKPVQAARRELLEETGYEAKRLTYLTTIASSLGFTAEHIDLFLARDLVYREASPDEGEFINVDWIPYYKVINAIEQHRIIDGKTINAILFYEHCYNGF
jgi:ADP-ribose pyrophosphatase